MADGRVITDEELRKIRAETQLTFGKEYLRAGRYEEALAAFEEATKIDAGETRALMGRSLALTRLGRYDEALAVANDIFRLAPNSPHGYNAQAVVYQATGRLVEAQAAFERSIAFGPNLAGNHYNFACFWAARADAERCREYLTRALELEPRLNVIAATDVDLEQYRSQDWFLELVAFK
ncbi:MAG: tetratricopeptide repeat protein [candidate division Zixibacteria bacterium]|nr:tetratricopeptide repeat protein [candidate division Zixibacteria bacterium]